MSPEPVPDRRGGASVPGLATAGAAPRGWLSRYADPERPTVGQVARDIGVRGLLPMLGLLAVNLGLGFVIMRVLGALPSEGAVNASLQAGRTPLMDALTRAASAVGSAPGNIGGCVVFMAVLLWLTKRWWVAIVPGVALSLEAIVHAVTSSVIDRPRPPVDQLDVAQPTASFPSGHVGATLAQLLVLCFFGWAVRAAWLRFGVVVLALLLIGFLAYSRLYLGMHHFTDVGVGVLNGLVCGVLGWNYLRRSA